MWPHLTGEDKTRWRSIQTATAFISILVPSNFHDSNQNIIRYIKTKVQTKKPNTSCTATRNTEKSRYSHHITNHQLTSAILFFFLLYIITFSLSHFLTLSTRDSNLLFTHPFFFFIISFFLTPNHGFHLTGSCSHLCHASLNHSPLRCFLQAKIQPFFPDSSLQQTHLALLLVFR